MLIIVDTPSYLELSLVTVRYRYSLVENDLTGF